mmetsp:Transcript_22019/g.64939  ORF Transcript_22019/g.64939 Transcript_22019/m.64939 type:complete len:200 (+) Transcript_22019:163-762(+)
MREVVKPGASQFSPPQTDSLDSQSALTDVDEPQRPLAASAIAAVPYEHTLQRSPRWPAHLASTNHMKMEVKDRLAPILAVVDDDPESIGQAFLFGHGVGHEEQVAQERLVALLRLAELREPVPNFGDDKKVRRRDGVDIPERECCVILVKDVGGDLLANDLVKYGRRAVVGRRERTSLLHLRHIAPHAKSQPHCRRVQN